MGNEKENGSGVKERENAPENGKSSQERWI
jgi:hypothetical protein